MADSLPLRTRVRLIEKTAITFCDGDLTPTQNLPLASCGGLKPREFVKAEVATGKGEVLTGKAEVATDCAKYGNVLAEVPTSCAKHGNVLTEVLTGKTEAATDCAIHANVLTEVPTGKAEAATDCAIHANVLTEVPTGKAEAATGCAIQANVLAEVVKVFKETIEIFFDDFLSQWNYTMLNPNDTQNCKLFNPRS